VAGRAEETAMNWHDEDTVGQVTPKIIVKTYKGRQAQATALFEADSAEMAAKGYFPTSQSWAPGAYSGKNFFHAVLLAFFLIGILLFFYMLFVKPPGTLTVIYELRAFSISEKTCPKCAEQVKAAALVCHFCGHEFTSTQYQNSVTAVRAAATLSQHVPSEPLWKSLRAQAASNATVSFWDRDVPLTAWISQLPKWAWILGGLFLLGLLAKAAS
jgi:uncharacterized protein UPF0547